MSQIKEEILLFPKSPITKQNAFPDDLLCDFSTMNVLKCPVGGGGNATLYIPPEEKGRNLNSSSVIHGAYFYMDLH